MKLLSFGEIIWDIYPNDKTLGGAPLNFAAHSCLFGNTSYLLSSVGNDNLGTSAIEQIEKLGIRTDYIGVTNEKQTGQCIVNLDSQGVPSYKIMEDTAYDYISGNLSGEEFDVLAFGTLALRNEHNINTLKNIIKDNKFSQIYSDLNIRAPFYSEKSINFCLGNSTITKISDEELPIITKTLFDDCLNIEDSVLKISQTFKNIKLIIITKGANGSLCYDTDKKEFYTCDAVKTEVKSTVGAGDSFGASFLSGHFKGFSYKSCLELASKVSSFVCSHSGAIPENMKNFVEKILL